MTKTMGSGAAGVAQPAGDGEAVHVGEHHVEDDEVELVLGGLLQGGGAVAGHVDLEAGEAQRRGEQLADVGLVLDDEEPGLGRGGGHDDILASESESWLGAGTCAG